MSKYLQIAFAVLTAILLCAAPLVGILVPKDNLIWAVVVVAEAIVSFLICLLFKNRNAKKEAEKEASLNGDFIGVAIGGDETATDAEQNREANADKGDK